MYYYSNGRPLNEKLEIILPYSENDQVQMIQMEMLNLESYLENFITEIKKDLNFLN